MAEYCFNDASVTLNAVDLSDHVSSISASWDLETLDTTAMGDTAARNFIAGLYGWTVSVTFHQDFEAAKVDASLAVIQTGGAPVALILRPTSAVKGADNPEWTGNVLLTSYPFLDGSVGDLGSTSVTLQGTGTLTRAVA
jgi:hypothetical protein